MYYYFFSQFKKKTPEQMKAYCVEMNLNYNSLLNIRQDHLQFNRLTSEMSVYRDKQVKTFDDFTNVLISLFSGYYIYSAMKGKKKGKFINWFPEKVTIGNISRDSLIGKNDLTYIFYCRLLSLKGNLEMKICNKITLLQMRTMKEALGIEQEFFKRKKSSKQK